MSRHETTKACALILSCCSNYSISTVQERNETGGNMIREDQKYFGGLALLQPQLVKFLRGSEHFSSSCSKSLLIRPRTPCTFMNFFSSFLLNSSSTKTTRSSGFRFDFNFNALLIFIVERLMGPTHTFIKACYFSCTVSTFERINRKNEAGKKKADSHCS